MHKNLCCGCGLNFGTMESFERHRVGDFDKDRRCLTPAEMQTKGWEYSEPMVTFYRDGKHYQEKMPTWLCPISEKRKKSLEKIRTKGAEFEEVA